MRPFAFTDGTTIAPGNVLAVPQRAIMHDPVHYKSPLHFDGFRFARGEGESTARRFTTPHFAFPFWGSVKRPCPGRFYADVIAKMIFLRFVRDFDFQLERPDGPRSLAWNYAVVPHPSLRIVIRKKTLAV